MTGLSGWVDQGRIRVFGLKKWTGCVLGQGVLGLAGLGFICSLVLGLNVKRFKGLRVVYVNLNFQGTRDVTYQAFFQGSFL